MARKGLHGVQRVQTCAACACVCMGFFLRHRGKYLQHQANGEARRRGRQARRPWCPWKGCWTVHVARHISWRARRLRALRTYDGRRATCYWAAVQQRSRARWRAAGTLRTCVQRTRDHTNPTLRNIGQSNCGMRVETPLSVGSPTVAVRYTCTSPDYYSFVCAWTVCNELGTVGDYGRSCTESRACHTMYGVVRVRTRTGVRAHALQRAGAFPRTCLGLPVRCSEKGKKTVPLTLKGAHVQVLPSRTHVATPEH